MIGLIKKIKSTCDKALYIMLMHNIISFIVHILAKSEKKWAGLFVNHPLMRLIRIQAPVPYLLLFAPNLWMILAATESSYLRNYYIVVFAIGTFFVRSLGCAINDIFDREIDKKCERTKGRPLASGEITLLEAWKIVGFLAIAVMLIGMFLPAYVFSYGALIIGPMIIIYPLIKRFNNYPQVFLGFIFNSGVLLAWFSLRDKITFIPILIYAGSACWCIGYDLLYGHQDYDDDLREGIGSLAVTSGEASGYVAWFFYRIALLLIGIVGIQLQAGIYFYAMLGIGGISLYWQSENFDFENKEKSRKLFIANIIFCVSVSSGFFLR